MSGRNQENKNVSVFWFRRDLRMEDNRALAEAIGSEFPVLPLFIFDTNILEELPPDDPRISFIHEILEKLYRRLASQGSFLLVIKGDPLQVWKDLIPRYRIRTVYINKDYEPYALQRDRSVGDLLKEYGIRFRQVKDQVIFEEAEIVKKDGKPYTVFTPYKRKWLEQFPGSGSLKINPKEDHGFLNGSGSFPALRELGFQKSTVRVPPYDLSRVAEYPHLRDIPSADATSHLSPHLRFGTVSIRQVIRRLGPSDELFLSELIWREFFMQILYHFPHVVDQNFNPKYNGIRWRNDPEDFTRWCDGKTGYPMVDAGMRQLNKTGFMHNRVRMVTAGFLCKHLLIDWRMGEAYFASRLLDYELSSNNGNWQWAAGTGCDAAPYFRVFNPTQQMKRFDPDLAYVKQWIPEFGTPAYPAPMIDHKFARDRAIAAYRQGIREYLPGA